MSCMTLIAEFTRYVPRGLLIAGLLAAAPFPGHAQQFMTEEELLSTIPGAVINGTSNDGTQWAQAYSAYQGGAKKGAIKVNFGGQMLDSKWSVKNGQWCEDWGSGKACWQVERVDAKSLRMYENGKPRKNLWKLK